MLYAGTRSQEARSTWHNKKENIITTISVKEIANTIQEVMDEIKEAEFGFDLIWVLDKIPTECVSTWGMKSPAVNVDLTKKIRKMADNDLLFVVHENDDVSEYSIIYYDTDNSKWYTNGYEEGRSEINAADIDSIWNSYVALTDPDEMLDSDGFFYNEDFLEEVRQAAIIVSGFTGVKKACDLISSVLSNSNFTVKDFGDTSPESVLIGTLTVVGDYSGEEYKVGYGRPKFRLYHVNQDKDD